MSQAIMAKYMHIMSIYDLTNYFLLNMLFIDSSKPTCRFLKLLGFCNTIATQEVLIKNDQDN